MSKIHPNDEINPNDEIRTPERLAELKEEFQHDKGVSTQIEEQLKILQKLVEDCKYNIIQKKTIFYDDSIESKLLKNLRNLISFKIKNWDYIEPNKGNRNTLIYNIIPYLINTEGEFKNQKFEDKNNVTKMLRGYDRVLSLQGPNNTNEFHFVFYLVGSAVLSLASKAMDVKKILLEKDKQLLDELKFLIEKFSKRTDAQP